MIMTIFIYEFSICYSIIISSAVLVTFFVVNLINLSFFYKIALQLFNVLLFFISSV